MTKESEERKPNTLHEAVASGDFESISDMIKNGADPFEKDKDGKIPSEYAKKGSVEEISIKGIEEFYLKNDIITFLERIVAADNVELFKEKLASGVNFLEREKALSRLAKKDSHMYELLKPFEQLQRDTSEMNSIIDDIRTKVNEGTMPNPLRSQAIPLHSQDEAMPLHGQDEAMPLHGQAMPLHSQDEAMPLHGQDEAMPLHGQAMPLHSQDEAMPLHSQDEAMPLHSQDEAMPLHTMAKIGNYQGVVHLVQSGFNPLQEDKNGRTASQCSKEGELVKKFLESVEEIYREKGLGKDTVDQAIAPTTGVNGASCTPAKNAKVQEI